MTWDLRWRVMPKDCTADDTTAAMQPQTIAAAGMRRVYCGRGGAAWTRCSTRQSRPPGLRAEYGREKAKALGVQVEQECYREYFSFLFG